MLLAGRDGCATSARRWQGGCHYPRAVPQFNLRALPVSAELREIERVGISSVLVFPTNEKDRFTARVENEKHPEVFF